MFDTIGSRLHAILYLKKMTMQEVANKGGMSRNHIAAFVKDVIEPSLLEFQILMDVLDITTDEGYWLYCGEQSDAVMPQWIADAIRQH